MKYSKADLNHLLFKCYPSPDAARQRLPHRGFRYSVEKVRLPIPDGVTLDRLFGRRQDLDLRVAADRRHLERLGANLSELEAQLTRI